MHMCEWYYIKNKLLLLLLLLVVVVVVSLIFQGFCFSPCHIGYSTKTWNSLSNVLLCFIYSIFLKICVVVGSWDD